MLSYLLLNSFSVMPQHHQFELLHFHCNLLDKLHFINRMGVDKRLSSQQAHNCRFFQNASSKINQRRIEGKTLFTSHKHFIRCL